MYVTKMKKKNIIINHSSFHLFKNLHESGLSLRVADCPVVTYSEQIIKKKSMKAQDKTHQHVLQTQEY